jgi:hypothetical protein
MMMTVCNIPLRNPERQRALGRPNCICENIFKMDVKEMLPLFVV